LTIWIRITSKHYFIIVKSWKVYRLMLSQWLGLIVKDLICSLTNGNWEWISTHLSTPSKKREPCWWT